MSSPLSLFERGLRLAQKAEASIQGSNGNAALFNVVDPLITGLLLDANETYSAITQSGWNERCLPPWSERELRISIPRIRTNSRRLPGYLLSERDSRAATSWKTQPATPAPSAPAMRTDYTPAELEAKARQQSAWPALRPTNNSERNMIPPIRFTPSAPVDILAQCGLIMIDPARADCFVLSDGRTNGRGHRQYRKFDGTLFPNGRKSKNATGSAAKGFFTFCPQPKLDPDELIFIVEGTIGLLEAVSCGWLCEGRARRWRFVAAHSAISTWHAEPDLLSTIAGHHVRILPDAGAAGLKGAKAWRDELRSAACTVDFVTLPDGCQDLKRLLAAGSDGVAAIQSLFRYPTSRNGGAA